MKAILILIIVIMLHLVVERMVNDVVTKAGGQPIHVNYQVFTDFLTDIQKKGE